MHFEDMYVLVSIPASQYLPTWTLHPLGLHFSGFGKSTGSNIDMGYVGTEMDVHMAIEDRRRDICIYNLYQFLRLLQWEW